MMSCCTDTTMYADQCTNYLKTLINIDKATAARPIVTFKIECWSMSKGGKNKDPPEKVVIHTAS